MKTIETIAHVAHDRRLIVDLPMDILPGEHHVVVIIDENKQSTIQPELLLPVHDLGQWPTALTLHREDLYGENGR